MSRCLESAATSTGEARLWSSCWGLLPGRERSLWARRPAATGWDTRSPGKTARPGAGVFPTPCTAGGALGSRAQTPRSVATCHTLGCFESVEGSEAWSPGRRGLAGGTGPNSPSRSGVFYLALPPSPCCSKHSAETTGRKERSLRTKFETREQAVGAWSPCSRDQRSTQTPLIPLAFGVQPVGR